MSNEFSLNPVNLKVDPMLAGEWAKLPFKERMIYLCNASTMPPEKQHMLAAFASDSRNNSLINLRLMHMYEPVVNGYSVVEADINVFEWLLKGDSILPTRSMKTVIEDAFTPVEAFGPALEGKLPCRGRYLHKTIGVMLSFPQLRSLTTLIWMLSGLKFLKLEDFKWLNTEEVIATGCVAFNEESAFLAAQLMKWSKNAVREQANPNQIVAPTILGKGIVGKAGEESHTMSPRDVREGILNFSTVIRLVSLSQTLLNQSIALIRNALPPNVAELFRKEDFPAGSGVADWVRFIVKAQNALNHPTLTVEVEVEEEGKDETLALINTMVEEHNTLFPDDPATVTILNDETTQPLVSDDAEEQEQSDANEAPTEQEVPTFRRRAKRMAREQGYDALPNLLEGVDAYDVLQLVKESNDGAFEKVFNGTPKVAERLRNQSGENRGEKEKTDSPGIFTSRRVQGAAPLTVVTKGNLVFTTPENFKAVDELRYASRRRLRELGHATDNNRTHIQVLCPHEFGQVPGFVAGQHLDYKDRLGVVLITYDRQFETMTLAERKTYIHLSKGPKVLAYACGWLKGAPSGQPWYMAGWFGTPKDPYILDFMVPNGNYDI